MNFKNCKVIVFDCDDTMCKTAWVFDKKLRECALFIAKKLGRETETEWYLRLVEINNRLFETFKVNPKRWFYVVDEVLKMANEEIKKTGGGNIPKHLFRTINFY